MSTNISRRIEKLEYIKKPRVVGIVFRVLDEDGYPAEEIRCHGINQKPTHWNYVDIFRCDLGNF